METWYEDYEAFYTDLQQVLIGEPARFRTCTEILYTELAADLEQLECADAHLEFYIANCRTLLADAQQRKRSLVHSYENEITQKMTEIRSVQKTLSLTQARNAAIRQLASLGSEVIKVMKHRE